MSVWGGMLGGAATGAGVGSMAGGPYGMAIGAGVGALAGGYASQEQQRAEEKKWKRQNALYAKNIELSPWIGMTTQAPQESQMPGDMQQVMQGVGTGAQLYGAGKQMQSNQDIAQTNQDLIKSQIELNKMYQNQAAGMKPGYNFNQNRLAYNTNPWSIGG